MVAHYITKHILYHFMYDLFIKFKFTIISFDRKINVKENIKNEVFLTLHLDYLLGEC